MENRKNKPFAPAQDCVAEDLGGGIKRKILAFGDDLMHVEVSFEEGAKGTMHSHPHTQTTYVLEGEFEFSIDGETRIVKKGDTMYEKPNVIHGCKCIKKGVLLDTFSPIREDFLG